MVRPTAFSIKNYSLLRAQGKWWAAWKEHDKEGKSRRRRCSLGLKVSEPESVAQAALSKWVRAREAALRQDQKLTIADLMDEYIEDRRAAGKNAKKMESQWQSLKEHFAKLQPADLAIGRKVPGHEGKLTPCHLYAVLRDEQGKARDTIHSELSLLRSAVLWGLKNNRLSEKVFVWVSSPGDPRRTALTEDEIVRLLGAIVEAHDHIRLLILIALATGARKQAILDLTWDRVDLVHMSINFRTGERKSILDTSHKKGRAVVDIAPGLYEALVAAKEWAKTDHVIEYQGRPLKDPHAGVKEVFKRAGLDGRYLGLHALRHTLATSAADVGIDMRKIQLMLGHSDIRTTEAVYVELRRGHLRDVAEITDRHVRRIGETRSLPNPSCIEDDR